MADEADDKLIPCCRQVSQPRLLLRGGEPRIVVIPGPEHCDPILRSPLADSPNPPAKRISYCGGFLTTVDFDRLAREVAALPPYLFMPLNEAVARAADRLGSSSLAGRDLTQHARARRLTVAMRWIWPDGREQMFILRSRFWQWYAICARDPAPEIGRQESVSVLGAPGNRVPLRGQGHGFVGRRRFERLYSATPPSKPEPAPASRRKRRRKRLPTKRRGKPAISPALLTGKAALESANPMKIWIVSELKAMLKAGEISPATRITPLAKELQKRLLLAVADRRMNKPVTWQHIKNELYALKLWPIFRD
jgi:hypothetical protein